ncbi:hypothetical protein [Bordetella petrii]|uniref:hypothetical protein n=1 Tax=Bordetella petrii TaxID=94624 RepID=UPI000309E0BA|nr:hypothetical protein [Bordetella petrii]
MTDKIAAFVAKAVGQVAAGSVITKGGIGMAEIPNELLQGHMDTNARELAVQQQRRQRQQRLG